MFETLIESRAAGIRPGPSVAWSAVLHALLAAGAVLATRRAVFMIDQDGNDPGVDWLLPPPPPATPITETAEASDLPARPERWFETVPTIIEVPTGIPQPVLENRFSPASFSGTGSELSSRLPAGGSASGDPFLDDQVDEPVEVILRPEPRYPQALQHAGIEGFVEARFVVDTAGHVEPNSWKVVASTNPHFELPVREALRRSLFKPARLKGRPVRQLVQQRFGFAITP